MWSKKLSILYWVFTVVAVLILGTAGVISLFRIDGVPKVIGGAWISGLLMTFLGLTNLLAVAAVILPVPNTIRECAYAGFTFDLVAAISLLSSGHPVIHITDPMITLNCRPGKLSLLAQTVRETKSCSRSVGPSHGNSLLLLSEDLITPFVSSELKIPRRQISRR